MAVDRVMGWGDYTIKKNTIAYPSQATSVPTFGRGSIRITHKEYVGTVTSTEGFSNSGVTLNPGLASSFPWLSTIAGNFEQYRWNGLIFNYVSTSGDALNSTNTALGKVVMATEYNAMDELYYSIQQMMGSEFSNMGKPSDNILHAVECAPHEQAVKLYWVRTGPAPSASDLRLYDHGVFQLATQGTQAETQVGDLWVTYDVTLFKPVLNTPLGLTSPVSHWYLTNVADDDIFGTSWTAENGSNLGGVRIDGDHIYFPPNDTVGTYGVLLNISGTPSTTIDFGTIAPTNCNFKQFFRNGTLSTVSNDGATDTQLFLFMVIQVTDVNANIAFAGVNIPNAATGDLVVMQWPRDMV